MTSSQQKREERLTKLEELSDEEFDKLLHEYSPVEVKVDLTTEEKSKLLAIADLYERLKWLVEFLWWCRNIAMWVIAVGGAIAVWRQWFPPNTGGPSVRP